MRVAIAGANGDEIRSLVHDLGFETDQDNPEVVVSYGGDGTLLGAERDWPGVPKVAIRPENECIKCPDHEAPVVLKRLAAGNVSRTTLMKLEALAKGKRLLAINDIGLHHEQPTSGVRFCLWINDEPYSHEIVGDGVVVATPFGSTAYYRSITRSFFRSGIGIAFNNTTEQFDHLVVGDNGRLRLVVTRGPALLCADNSPEQVELTEGDEAQIGRASETAVLLAISTLLCNKCRRRDGAPFNRFGSLMTL